MARVPIENLKDRDGNSIQFKDKEMREQVAEFQATASTAVATANEARETATRAADYVAGVETRVENAASAAEGSAQSAEQSRSAAENAADSAEEAKTAASESSAQASSSASEAEEIMNTVLGYSRNAAASAQDADTAYRNALAQAERADDRADDAANSAGDAADSAEDSATSAQNSEASRSRAQGHAEDAAAEAAKAARSAEAASASETAAGESASAAAESARTLTVDATLSEAGRAADAKAAGDAVAELKRDLGSTGLSGNLIPFDYQSGDTLEHNGITFTKNTDGTVSSVGTATNQARYYWIGSEGIEIPAGTYVLSGIPVDAGNWSFGLQYAIGNGDFITADYTRIYTDTELTISAGQKISLRTWYYAGYEDLGHTWSICLGNKIATLNNNYNPNTFVPIIYSNQQAAGQLPGLNSRISALESLTYMEPLADSFELGSFTSGGRPTDATNAVRTSGYLPKPDAPIPVKVKSGLRAYVQYYNTDTSISAVGSSGWIYPDDEYSIETTYNFYRYVVQTVPLADIPVTDVDTVGNAFYHDVSTEIVKTVIDLSEKVDAMEDGEAPLADYWKTYLASISDDINNALYTLGNHGDSFLFFTDYHYDKSADKLTGGEQLYKVLEHIRARHAVCKIINGGDLLQTHATTADALEELNIFYQHFHRFDRMYNVIGNHDSNHYQADARLTDNQMYQDLFAGFGIENKSNLNPGMYYYFDNSTQKIRYIILNTEGNYATFSADSAQHQWLIDTLEDTPEGYGIVVIPHWFFEINEEDATITQLSSHGTLIKSLLDAYNGKESGTWSGLSYDFSNAGGKVIAVITGHVHREYSEISAAGYPMIGFICDAVNGSAQLTTRTIGTYTEHSVSLITINTTAKTIVCTPIGAGTSRSFSYA